MRSLLLTLLLLVAACAQTSPKPPLSQRIVYAVVDDAGVTTTVTTDIQPPYRARTVTSKQGGFAWDESALYSIGPDGTATQTEYVGPGFPGPASHLDVALPVALRQHLVTQGAAGAVGRRACTHWLSELPLDGATFSPPAAADHADSCVDPAGRVLSETWMVSGRVVRTKTATFVGSGPTLNHLALYGGSRPAPMPTSASAYVVKQSSPAELSRLLQIPAPAGPAGLSADRAAAVLDLDPARQGYSREAAVLTWISGSHLAVLRVERDLEAGGGRTIRGEPVALGGLGRGRLEPVLAGLRVTVIGPRALRLIATADLPEPELLAWLRSLRF